jgi:hypothetical protein
VRARFRLGVRAGGGHHHRAESGGPCARHPVRLERPVVHSKRVSGGSGGSCSDRDAGEPAGRRATACKSHPRGARRRPALRASLCLHGVGRRRLRARARLRGPRRGRGRLRPRIRQGAPVRPRPRPVRARVRLRSPPGAARRSLTASDCGTSHSYASVSSFSTRVPCRTPVAGEIEVGELLVDRLVEPVEREAHENGRQGKPRDEERQEEPAGHDEPEDGRVLGGRIRGQARTMSRR